jgi:flagellar protein FlaI
MFGHLETNIDVSIDEINRLLRNISERYGKVLSYTHPIIDIHLPDGSRFNIVYGEDISLRGSNFTIRKFPKEPISVAQLIRWKTFSPELGAYLWMLFEVGISAMVCGETASGKTTTLNALTGFINSDSKIISIEETPEVNLFHKNWIREVTRLHTGAPVTMFDLLKAALRQRPDYIIVGEIRGEEGRVAFQAIETGHPVLSTMHAGTLGQLFQRLTSHPIDVPKTHIDGLNLTVFQARMERGKRFIRRVTSVNEIIGYESEEGRLNYLPTFIYDSDLDRLRFMGSSFHLETKVLTFRGWGKERLRELYDELKARAEILNFLAENFPRYTDVWKTCIAVREKGIWGVYRRVKEMSVPWE